jgi:hypothetical protein
MKRYRMTDAELKNLLEACKPVPYLVIGGIEPRSPAENAFSAWRDIAVRLGYKVETIESAGTGDDHDFMAEPQEEKS